MKRLILLSLATISIAAAPKKQSAAIDLRRFAPNLQRLECVDPDISPTKKPKMVSKFGFRSHPIFGIPKMHTGIDFDGKTGDTIFATAPGVIVQSKYHNSYGNFILIDHCSVSSFYAHLSKSFVHVGQLVTKHQAIGLMGTSGSVTGSHVHYEIRDKNNKQINPIKYLK